VALLAKDTARRAPGKQTLSLSSFRRPMSYWLEVERETCWLLPPSLANVTPCYLCQQSRVCVEYLSPQLYRNYAIESKVFDCGDQILLTRSYHIFENAINIVPIDLGDGWMRASVSSRKRNNWRCSPFCRAPSPIGRTDTVTKDSRQVSRERLPNARRLPCASCHLRRIIASQRRKKDN
jgi:hypothetical protein